MLIGMAAKNAILIVEFANDEFQKGLSLFDAAMAAAKSRFRPILMTAFSFILGVFPLVIASGSGAEARKVMGMALLGGMGLATLLGVFLYPMLFVFIGKIAGYEKKRDANEIIESENPKQINDLCLYISIIININCLAQPFELGLIIYNLKKLL